MLTLQIISGFTQREGAWNGCSELKEKLLAELDQYSPLSVRIRLDPWNANWKYIAREMHLLRLRYPREPFVVGAFAYSWGVGYGLKKLSAQLGRFGIPVNTAVTSDGIYHSWLPGALQWAGNWRAMLGRAAINLKNVQQLHGFHQEVSRPMGQRPSLKQGEVVSWEPLIYPHVEMDDAPEWHQRCIEVANELVAKIVRQPESVPIGAPLSEAVEKRRDERRKRVLDAGKINEDSET